MKPPLLMRGSFDRNRKFYPAVGDAGEVTRSADFSEFKGTATPFLVIPERSVLGQKVLDLLKEADELAGLL